MGGLNAGLVAERLGELTATGRTGTLHLPGGVFHVLAGTVAAESSRTPSLAARIGAAETGSFERDWLAAEATADAATELLTSAPPGELRFTEPGAESGRDDLGIRGLPLAALLAEVARRHKLLAQVAGVLTPDERVTRNLRLPARAVRISDSQWGILMQLGQPVTPRELALGLGQSVFGTTIEVYRMVIMDVVSVAGESRRGRPALSFLRALS